MRHKKIGRKLSRTSSHRKSMLRNMSTSLLEHEIIKTTLNKAKELRRFVEPIINSSKRKNLSNYRYVSQVLKSKKIVAKLFNDISKIMEGRKGGYTRIIKCGFRKGDNSKMAYIELVGRNKKRTLKNP
ncbi:50S ribosomal protein L17 [Candidatus Riesia pediculicola]|uniref:50S ribosomal protein L17 n=1 Tax=Candidatus Riesia pediculicola TaxID=401619 RepID=UPI0009C3AA55|nr:50S ribosomal protein L17 [Candidatus Riesia pediculicola]ARC54331.1 50S ribosomal protein L17 [Candidatus Riesia pediculicola]